MRCCYTVFPKTAVGTIVANIFSNRKTKGAKEEELLFLKSSSSLLPSYSNGAEGIARFATITCSTSFKSAAGFT